MFRTLGRIALVVGLCGPLSTVSYVRSIECPADPLTDVDLDGAGQFDTQHLIVTDISFAIVAIAADMDGDGDGWGDVCNACPFDPLNDRDNDGRCADVDNCPELPNSSQGDRDGDGEGDACDLDDGGILLLFSRDDRVDWHSDVAFNSWNGYRGDLTVLRDSGVYTQVPNSNALATRWCAFTTTGADDPTVPVSGSVAFYLATGNGPTESDLGPGGAGAVRPNDTPCPPVPSINPILVEHVEFTPDPVHDGPHDLNAAPYPDLHPDKPPSTGP